MGGPGYTRPAQICAAVLEDIICYTVVPMDIGIAVDDKALVIRQLLLPRGFVMVNCPVAAVIAPPEYGFAVFINKVFSQYPVKQPFLRGVYFDAADSVEAPFADGNSIASN